MRVVQFSPKQKKKSSSSGSSFFLLLLSPFGFFFCTNNGTGLKPKFFSPPLLFLGKGSECSHSFFPFFLFLPFFFPPSLSYSLAPFYLFLSARARTHQSPRNEKKSRARPGERARPVMNIGDDEWDDELFEDPVVFSTAEKRLSEREDNANTAFTTKKQKREYEDALTTTDGNKTSMGSSSPLHKTKRAMDFASQPSAKKMSQQEKENQQQKQDKRKDDNSKRNVRKVLRYQFSSRPEGSHRSCDERKRHVRILVYRKREIYGVSNSRCTKAGKSSIVAVV